MSIVQEVEQANTGIAHDYIDQLFETVQKRNPGETEFHQAVKEVFLSLIPVLSQNPKYIEHAVLDLRSDIKSGDYRVFDVNRGISLPV